MRFWQDVRFAVRTMLKSPGFTAVAILALGVGIGPNTAIFTVVNSVLLRALPYHDADRMVFLTRSFPQGKPMSSSVPKYFVWKRTVSDVLADIAAYDFMGPGVSLTGVGEPEQVKAIHASAEYFPLFGAVPVLGRSFTAEEDRPGGPRVAVISSGLWKRRYGGDPGLVGHSIVLSGEPHVVVGVAPPDFEPNPPADIWLPLQADPASLNQGHYLMTAARLKPGVTLERANARMKAAAERFRALYPDSIGKNESAAVTPMREILVGPIRPVLLIMLGAVGFVLLIACANVANLLLARAASREKEVAIRTALGAGRWRVLSQLLTESALLSLAGGVLGLVLGYWGVQVLLAFAPAGMPRIAEVAGRSALDPRVLGFTLLLSLATGILFGLAPAFHASRANLNSTLKEGTARTTSGVRHLRARGLLVVSEMALGLVLLIGAGLLIRSALSLRTVQPGFDTRNILAFRTAMTNERYTKTAAVAQFTRQLTDRIESLPGVQALGNAVSLPVEGPGPDLTFQIEGRPASDPNGTGDEQWRYVSPHFFKALGIPLLRGREFTERDVAGASPVIIVNEALAKKYWPKGSPMGQRMTIGKGLGPEFTDPAREIVGVVANVREFGLNRDQPPIMYVPQAQVSDALTALGNRIIPVNWVLRTAVPPMTLANLVRREVTAVDSQQAVFEFRTMEQVLETSMATGRFILLLLTAFAGIALLLAAIGIYGVMSYTVQQRTHEIGIRMALGAGQGEVLKLVVRYGMVLTGLGVGIGLAAAFGLTRVLRALLFGVNASDPVTFAAVALVLAAVALFAVWVPARRATRVDPLIALRYE